MNSFDITLHTEDIMNYEKDDAAALIKLNDDIYNGVDSLVLYGDEVGFSSAEFSAACEEAYNYATCETTDALRNKEIFNVKDFTSFVIGFAYAKGFYQLF